MRGAALMAAALPAACAAGGGVPADICRSGEAPPLVGRNIGEVALAPGLPHRVLVPGAAPAQAPPGTLLLRVDDKGWITAAGCAR